MNTETKNEKDASKTETTLDNEKMNTMYRSRSAQNTLVQDIDLDKSPQPSTPEKVHNFVQVKIRAKKKKTNKFRNNYAQSSRQSIISLNKFPEQQFHISGQNMTINPDPPQQQSSKK